MATQISIPITTTHSREKFPTAKSVADYLGVPHQYIYAHTTQINGEESDLIFVCWRSGTIFPDGVTVFIQPKN